MSTLAGINAQIDALQERRKAFLQNARKLELEIENYFLCQKSSAPVMIAKAEKERDQILAEFRVFYSGDIGVRIYEVQHTMGASIAGDMTVNGETCRQYDSVDLCFLDLHHLMLKRMIELGSNKDIPGGAFTRPTKLQLEG